MADQDWADLARNSARALGLLGYAVSDCLPGDAEPCGGTFIEHAAANLAALTAVIDHHLEHLQPPSGMFTSVYSDTEAKLLEPGCQLYAVEGGS